MAGKDFKADIKRCLKDMQCRDSGRVKDELYLLLSKNPYLKPTVQAGSAHCDGAPHFAAEVPGGRREIFLQLEGTVQMYFKGQPFFIPLVVRIKADFPTSVPEFDVTPTSGRPPPPPLLPLTMQP
jgi:hypothetical protein